MKLIKFLIKLVLFLVLLVLIIVGILLWILSDGSKTEFTPSEEAVSIETVLGEGLDNSINRIAALDKATRASSDDNYLGISLSIEDLNNVSVAILRDKFNENYMKDGDTKGIVEANGLSLQSVLFEELDGKIAAKARITALGFYKSSVTLSGTPKMVGNELQIQFEEFKLGNKLNIKRKTVVSLFEKLNVAFDGGGYFDSSTLTLSIDVANYINQYTSGNRFSQFFNGATYMMDYVKAEGENPGRIDLKMDSKKIFDNFTAVPEATTFALPAINPLDPSITISESDFNYLIRQQFNEVQFMDPITLGGKSFTFTMDSLYYNLEADEVLAVLSVNTLKANITASVNLEPIMDESSHITEIVLKVSTISLGKVTVDAKDYFSEVRIPASVLTNDTPGVYVTAFTVDKTEEKVNVSYSIA